VIDIIAGIGVCQGAVLLIAVYRFRRYNPAGFHYLFLALFAGWAILIEEWMVHLDLWYRFPHILRLTTWMPFLIGPSLWLFARSLDRVVAYRHDAVHFVPAMAALLYFLPFYFLSGEAKIAFVLGTHDIPLDVSIIGTAKAISLIGYLVLVLIWLRRRPATRMLVVFFWLIVGFLGFTLLIAANFFTEHIIANFIVSSDLVSVFSLAILLYAVSLTVLVEWRMFAASFVSDVKNPTPDKQESRSAYLLDAETAQTLFREIEGVVKQRMLYLKPALGVRDLSQSVEMPEHYLSYVINSVSGKNIRAWLNQLRIEQACTRLLSEPERGVLDIALESGFNSKAAFNRSFQTEMGVSPSEFRASHFTK